MRPEWHDGVDPVFMGDLLLCAALEGRLVMSRAQADPVIADLRHTLADLRDRAEPLDDTWAQALVELPKYIEALRIAAGYR
ncbi:hypothetical protein GCM10022243_01360 [Saccharothrix violaceirubra]|uniref:Uncharacterized protein n=1 Tax=Saccharothrix violaceirubra TaxID=413306 RepID=A0A7W7T2F6_9PSEU|nr:hypothetical protein [Saccharothrix violaceirubra]MBB4965365.1 hypothetical protein [Saccharothrix violaceirubra]